MEKEKMEKYLYVHFPLVYKHIITQRCPRQHFRVQIYSNITWKDMQVQALSSSAEEDNWFHTLNQSDSIVLSYVLK